MFFSKLKVLKSHGIQYIKDLDQVELPEIFRGRPEIRPGLSSRQAEELSTLCPSGAIGTMPLSIDLGRCIFCGECAARHPEHIRFTNDYRMAAARRQDLVIREGESGPVPFAAEAVRPEIPRLFGRALKLREVSVGGDASCEMELNATGNVNFDFGRFGVDFVASPRHADGLVITGPITENMAVPLEICYHAVPDPKIVVLAGTEAVSGGLYAESPALDRSFLQRHPADLYLPGNPVHPMTFIQGILSLLRAGSERESGEAVGEETPVETDGTEEAGV